MALVVFQTFSRAADSEALKEVYLGRLRNTTGLLREWGEDGKGELNRKGTKMLKRCIFAAYCALLGLGYGKEANTVLVDVSKNV